MGSGAELERLRGLYRKVFQIINFLLPGNYRCLTKFPSVFWISCTHRFCERTNDINNKQSVHTGSK